MIWADKETGLSPCFWLRAEGWFLMALVDCYEIMPEESYDHYRYLGALYKEALQGILKYQDPRTGLFYQLIDRPELEGNYLETSGSAMVAYSILKACRLGLLQKEKYFETGAQIQMCIRDRDKIPYYAGTAEYSCELELPQETKAANTPESPVRFIISDAWLQDCAELLVNGVSAGIKAWAPYQWEVPPEALKLSLIHI